MQHPLALFQTLKIMPVVRPSHPCHAACLKGLQRLSKPADYTPQTMEYNIQGPITCGHGKSGDSQGGASSTNAPDHLQASNAKFVIQWQTNSTYTQWVIKYLHAHPPDC